MQTNNNNNNSLTLPDNSNINREEEFLQINLNKEEISSEITSLNKMHYSNNSLSNSNFKVEIICFSNNHNNNNQIWMFLITWCPAIICMECKITNNNKWEIIWWWGEGDFFNKDKECFRNNNNSLIISNKGEIILIIRYLIFLCGQQMESIPK